MRWSRKCFFCGEFISADALTIEEVAIKRRLSFVLKMVDPVWLGAGVCPKDEVNVAKLNRWWRKLA